MLMYDRTQQNIVKQLFFNFKKSKSKKELKKNHQYLELRYNCKNRSPIHVTGTQTLLGRTFVF